MVSLLKHTVTQLVSEQRIEAEEEDNNDARGNYFQYADTTTNIVNKLRTSTMAVRLDIDIVLHLSVLSLYFYTPMLPPLPV